MLFKNISFNKFLTDRNGFSKVEGVKIKTLIFTRQKTYLLTVPVFKLLQPQTINFMLVMCK